MAQVTEKYKVYFYDRIAVDREFRRAVEALKGRRLGCDPQSCHAEVIAAFVDGIQSNATPETQMNLELDI